MPQLPFFHMKITQRGHDIIADQYSNQNNTPINIKFLAIGTHSWDPETKTAVSALKQEVARFPLKYYQKINQNQYSIISEIYSEETIQICEIGLITENNELFSVFSKKDLGLIELQPKVILELYMDLQFEMTDNFAINFIYSEIPVALLEKTFQEQMYHQLIMDHDYIENLLKSPAA